MKKPSVGIVIFGILFVLIGLQLFKGLTTYSAYKRVAPYIYDAVMAKMQEAGALIKTENIEAVKAAQINSQITIVEDQMQEYREKYLEGKAVPALTLAFIVFSIVAAVMFVFTGISICRLRTFSRFWISMSFLTGFIWIFLFFASTMSALAFIDGFTRRSLAIIAQIKSEPLLAPRSIFAVIDNLLLRVNSGVIIRTFFAYLVFMSITSIFFSRPKVREQLK